MTYLLKLNSFRLHEGEEVESDVHGVGYHGNRDYKLPQLLDLDLSPGSGTSGCRLRYARVCYARVRNIRVC